MATPPGTAPPALTRSTLPALAHLLAKLAPPLLMGKVMGSPQLLSIFKKIFRAF